jgi:hypothetical protein
MGVRVLVCACVRIGAYRSVADKEDWATNTKDEICFMSKHVIG